MSNTIEGEVIKAAEVPVYNTSIVAFSKTALLLAELTSTYKDKKYEVTTTDGMDEARKARAQIREVRYALEKFRKQEKADILSRGKAIDTDAKYLEEHLVAIEDPIHLQIKAEEDRKEAEKAERERLEKVRVDGIKVKINAIKQLALDNVGQPAAIIEIAVDLCKATKVEKEEYAEFAVEADEARSETLLALTKMLGAAELLEQQQAEVKRQQAELEAQRKEQEETARKQRAEAKRLQDAQTPTVTTEVVKDTLAITAELPPAAIPEVKLARVIHYSALPSLLRGSLPWMHGVSGASVVSTTMAEADPKHQEFYGGMLIFESCSQDVREAIMEVFNQLA